MFTKTSGDQGELEIVERVSCPNCQKKLMLLPPSFPLFDIQCTACLFRAQIKTNNSKPKDSILCAGWDIMDKVLKAGNIVPPMIANFVWQEKEISHQKIIFYPFISRAHLQKYTLSETARRANYKMFRYVKLNSLPSIILYER